MSKIRVSVLRNPFSRDREDREMERRTVQEILNELNFDTESTDVLAIDYDHKIELSATPESDHLIIRAVPKGEGAGMAIVGGALAVAGAALVIFGGPVGIAIGVALIGIGVGLIAGGVILANLDIPALDTDAVKQEVAPSIRGSNNRARRGAKIPIVLGRHLITPDVAALSFSSVNAGDQRLHQLFCGGYNDVAVDTSTLKIGETGISRYADLSYEVQRGASVVNSYYPYRAVDVSVGIEIKNADGPTVRTTNTNTYKISVIVSFPKGIGQYEGGNFVGRTVSYTIEYRPVGGSWSTIHSGSQSEPATDGYRLQYTKTLDNLTTGGADYVVNRQYEVRVTKTTGDSSSSKVVDSFYWDTLQSQTGKFDDAGAVETRPILQATQEKLLLIGLRTKATNQLNGVIDQFNFVGYVETREYSGTGSGTAQWTTAATRNPASAFLYILQSPLLNKKPVSDDKIDWPSLEAWWTFCDTKGFTCDAVLFGNNTIEELLTNIATSSRASWNLLDNKYTIIVDDTKATVVQAFTPRNTYGFVGSKSFADKPVTLKMQFVDASTGYVPSERIVSYDESTGTVEFDYDRAEIDGGISQEATLFGVTSAEHAAKIGVYQLACMYLRLEVFVFNVDIEYLIATRGDRCILTHDIPLLGLASGRIAAVTETTDTTGFTSDELFRFENGKSYSVQIRQQDGTISTHGVINPSTGIDVWTHDVEFITPITGTGVLFRGDLFAFGEAGSESRDVIITAITPGENAGSAKIVCVDYAPDIFNADSGIIPAYDPGISQYAETGGTAIGSIQNLLPEIVASFQNAASAAATAENAVQFDDLDNGYTSPSSVALDIVAYWTMNEASGVVLNDDSGLGNAVSAIGSVSRVTGIENNALRLDQNDWQYAPLFAKAEATTKFGASVADFTIAGWFRSNTTAGGAAARIADRQAASFWSIQIDQSAAHNQQITFIAAGAGTIGSTTAVDTSTFVHLALVVHADGSGEVYANGSLVASVPAASISYTAADVAIALGTEVSAGDPTNANTVIGDFDAWAVWNRALGETEIADLYSDPDRISTDLLKAFAQPIVPVLVGEGQFKACVLRWQAQTNNYGFLRFEIQATDDPTFTTWYAPNVDISDYLGDVGEVLNWYATIFIHPVPLDMTDPSDPQPRTTYYRVRQITRDGQTSAWSSIVSVQNTGIQNGDIFANAITANLINAGIAQVNSSLTIDATGVVGEGTDWRAVLTEEKLVIQEKAEEVWTDRVAMLRDSLPLEDIGSIRAQFIVHPDASLTGKQYGDSTPIGSTSYQLIGTLQSGEEVNPEYELNAKVDTVADAKFGTKAMVPEYVPHDGALGTIQVYGVYGGDAEIDAPGMYLSGWFRIPPAGSRLRGAPLMWFAESMFNQDNLYLEDAIGTGYTYAAADNYELDLLNVGAGRFLLAYAGTDGQTLTLVVFGEDATDDYLSFDYNGETILQNASLGSAIERVLLRHSREPDSGRFAMLVHAPDAGTPTAYVYAGVVPRDWDKTTNPVGSGTVLSNAAVELTDFSGMDIEWLNDSMLVQVYRTSGNSNITIRVLDWDDTTTPGSYQFVVRSTNTYGPLNTSTDSSLPLAVHRLSDTEITLIFSEWNGVSSEYNLKLVTGTYDDSTDTWSWGSEYSESMNGRDISSANIGHQPSSLSPNKFVIAYLTLPDDDSSTSNDFSIREFLHSSGSYSQYGEVNYSSANVGIIGEGALVKIPMSGVGLYPVTSDHVKPTEMWSAYASSPTADTSRRLVQSRISDDGSTFEYYDPIDGNDTSDGGPGFGVVSIDAMWELSVERDVTNGSLRFRKWYQVPGPPRGATITLIDDELYLNYQEPRAVTDITYRELIHTFTTPDKWHHIAMRITNGGDAADTITIEWAIDDNTPGSYGPVQFDYNWGVRDWIGGVLANAGVPVQDVLLVGSDEIANILISEAASHYAAGDPYAGGLATSGNVVIVPPAGGSLAIDGGFLFSGQLFDTDWHVIGDPGEPAFENGWVNYGTSGGTYSLAAFRKTPSGQVELRGLVRFGAIGPGTPIFTLPEGYRPVMAEDRLLVDMISNNGQGRLAIRTNGAVSAESPSNNNWLSLDGISFNVGDGYPTQGPKGDPGNDGAAGIAATWDSSTNYSKGAIVSYGTSLYQSLQDSNLNRNPTTETSWWFKVEFEPIGQFSTGWVSRTDWTDLNDTINHGLGAPLTKLLVTISISSDGTEANARVVGWTSYNRADTTYAVYGMTLAAVDDDNFQLQTGVNGVVFNEPANNGDLGALGSTTSYYYKIEVFSLPQYGLRGEQGPVGADGADGEAGIAVVWASATTYSKENIVSHNGSLYQSKTDSNVGNEPESGGVVDTTNWFKIEYAESTDEWHVIGDPGEPSFENGWANWNTSGGTYSLAAFRKTPSGQVELRGVMRSGTIGLATPIFTLPEGYRPVMSEDLLLMDMISNNGQGRLVIRTNGAVAAESPSSNNWLSLDGISFMSDSAPSAVRGEKGDAGIGAAWASGTTYSAGDIVSYGNSIYQSRVSSNTGNQPDTSADEWLKIEFGDPLSDVQVNSDAWSFGSAAFADGPLFSPVTIPARSKLLYHVYVPWRNDSGSWGGGFMEIQYRIDGGPWQTIGNSGHTSMFNGISAIDFYENTLLLDFSSHTTEFDIEFKWRFAAHSGTLDVNHRNQVDSTTRSANTPDAETGQGQFYAHQIIQVVNGVKGEKGEPGLAATWDSGTSYGQNDVVAYDQKIWISRASTNLNHQPDTSPTWWQEASLPSSNVVAFSAYRTSNKSYADGETFVFDAEYFDTHDAYNHTTGMFTAPVAGTYQFLAPVIHETTGTLMNFRLKLNGVNTEQAGYSQYRGETTGAFLLQLEAGHTVELVARGSMNLYGHASNHHSRFMGFLVSGAKGEKGDPGIGTSWDSGITYAEGSIAFESGVVYRSEQNSNLNHQPSLDDGTWWEELTYENTNLRVLHMEHRVPASTNSGTLTAGSWQTGPLNHVSKNTIPGASLNVSTYEFTLPPGRYFIDGTRNVFYVNRYASRLYDVTHGVTALVTGTGYASQGAGHNNDFVPIKGILEPTENTTYRIEVYCQTTRSDDGWGYNTTASYGGEDSVWALISIIDLEYTGARGPAGAPGTAATWSSGTTYSEGQTAVYDGILWISLQDSNLNNQPDVSPTYWQQHNWTNVVWVSEEPDLANMVANTLYLVF